MVKKLNKLTFCEHQRLAEMQYGDIFVLFSLYVVLRMFRLPTDSVADLSIIPPPVVVPGPDSYIPHRGS